MPASASSRRGILPPGSRATGRESSCGCRATSPGPSRRTERRARSAGSRSRVSPSCASRRGAPMPPSPRSGARRRRRRAQLERARLLPAFVEIMLAAGELESARRACLELEEIATGLESAMLDAMVAHARGALHLAEDEPREALVALRKAGETWRALDAPYEIARTRVLVGDACRSLGDEESAVLEHDAARSVFERLGAKPDLARFEASDRRARALAPRAGGPAARRRRQDESRDRGVARHQRAHRRAARPEHLREARGLVARRGDGVRVRARPRLSSRWSEMTTSGRCGDWWIAAMFGDRAASYRRSETTRRPRWQPNPSTP